MHDGIGHGVGSKLTKIYPLIISSQHHVEIRNAQTIIRITGKNYHVAVAIIATNSPLLMNALRIDKASFV